MPVGIGIVGAGYAANLHATAYRQLSTYDTDLVAVASRGLERARALAAAHGIKTCYADYQDLLKRDEVHLVDLCVPNQLHEKLAVEALDAGKHVVVEKPLTGYFGDASTPRREMLSLALASADRMIAAAERNGRFIMYAENWVYAPAIQKARRLIRASGGTALDLRGQEAHSGSHAAGYRLWHVVGGGAALRLGSHPIGAGLYLKKQEGLDRGAQPIGVRSVLADMADFTSLSGFREQAGDWMGSGAGDTETWAAIVVTFADGTRGTFFASDHLLGGIQNDLEVFLPNARIRCNLLPNNMCQAFAPNADVFADEYIAEKLATKAGWSYPAPDEDWAQGYPQECRDFVEAARDNRAPLSDGYLGRAVLEVIYGAYVSAQEGRRIDLAPSASTPS